MLLLELLLITRYAMADSAEIEQKCAETLGGLRTCTPYVEGNAKAPQPECCRGLKEVIINNRIYCLCLIIKNYNDSSLGLNINVTLALNVPVYCKVPANKSQCPAILHLDPNSPEAQVFNDRNKISNNGSSSSISPNPSAEGSSPGGKSKGATKTTPAKNNACYNRKRLLLFEFFLAGIQIWFS